VRSALGLAPLIVALAAFEVYCLVEVVRRPTRTLPRWLWAVICLASVPLGGVLYLVLGRGEVDGAPGLVEPVRITDRSVCNRPADRRLDRSTPPALATTGLTKRYGGHAALDEVSISVPAGSVFGLVGPNGAGKTTLLAILAGLRHPTSGQVSFGVPRGKVALLPDTPHFEPWLTAWEVVDLARQLAAPDTGPDRTTDALSRAGLADAAHRRTGGFSRGMLQRLGLAATIVGDPELLLLDEPCSALDPLGRREMLDLVGRLGGDHTVLFCSHILDDVQEVCDTVGILHNGHILFEGELNDLLVGHAAPMYTVRVRPPVGPVLDALNRADWVRSVEQVGAEEIQIRVECLADGEHHLAGLLAAAGAAVISVVPAGTDLEHVFLELVR
jgi:ABC-2 type transport system ATP-binding protein